MTSPPGPAWTFCIPRERNVGARAPVLSGDRIHASFMYDRGGLSESRLLVFSAVDGAELWSSALAHVANEPVLCDGVVYWSGYDGSLRALAADGRELWQAPGADANLGIPVVSGERIVVAEILGAASTTWCLDRATGATLWALAHGGHTYRLAAREGRLFQSSVAHTAMDAPPKCSFACISITSGRVLWSLSGRECFFGPVAVADRVLVCSDRRLAVFEAANGKTLGELRLGPAPGTPHLVPVSGAAQLLLWRDSFGGGSDSVRAIALSERQGLLGRVKVTPSVLWELTEPRGLCESPVQLPTGELVYLTHDGAVCVVDPDTGARVGEFSLKSRPSRFGGIRLSAELAVVAHGRNLLAYRADALRAGASIAP